MEKRHFVALDGLRGVAAVVVALFHIPHWAGGLFYPPGAYIAVDFFFLLSGFVIDYAYAERIKSGMSLTSFVRVRVIRLYPLIVAAAGIGLAVILIGRLLIHVGRFKLAAAFPFAVLAIPNPGLIDANRFALNSPAWSLFFEIIANAAFGVLLFRLSMRQLILVVAVAAACLAASTIHFGTVGFGDNDWWWWRGSVRTVFPFAMGMLLNRIAGATRIPALPFWLAALILVATFFLVPGGDRPWPVELVCIFVVYPLLILGAQAARPSAAWAVIARGSGFISYPLYILHWPLFDLFAIAFIAMGTSWSSAPAVLIVTLVAYGAGIIDARVRRWLSDRPPMGARGVRTAPSA